MCDFAFQFFFCSSCAVEFAYSFFTLLIIVFAANNNQQYANFSSGFFSLSFIIVCIEWSMCEYIQHSFIASWVLLLWFSLAYCFFYLLVWCRYVRVTSVERKNFPAFTVKPQCGFHPLFHWPRLVSSFMIGLFTLLQCVRCRCLSHTILSHHNIWMRAYFDILTFRNHLTLLFRLHLCVKGPTDYSQ